ncbi:MULTISPECIES: hypothetical protein [Streptomyces]|uniref:Uncharacterized protein n=1 Tax=Streptomyces fungicidicus TaxID=68203 RepID=A0ACC7Y3B1_9ACTN|nr:MULTISPECIES: hypothetical protein [Streptomyces]MBF4133152.1 hypothetical protein [Streptomyces albidoflavus]NUV76325.1 hypothetical protein [Streptomyces fungicidicus]PAX84150.1 hypothetical protein CLM81_18285 [Streptomyces albidoflavus]PAX84696.1 hypothetical protein CLM82_33025 [Streptomyces albidoflavus]PBO25060.1 hypothetical protein CLM85_06495 [Streptomyces albidoflavus]
MALNRKGSRLVTVDGAPYRRRVRHRPTYARGLCWTPLTYAVREALERGWDPGRPGSPFTLDRSAGFRSSH